MFSYASDTYLRYTPHTVLDLLSTYKNEGGALSFLKFLCNLWRAKIEVASDLTMSHTSRQYIWESLEAEVNVIKITSIWLKYIFDWLYGKTIETFSRSWCKVWDCQVGVTSNIFPVWAELSFLKTFITRQIGKRHKEIDCTRSVVGIPSLEWKSRVSKQSTGVVRETALIKQIYFGDSPPLLDLLKFF